MTPCDERKPKQRVSTSLEEKPVSQENHDKKTYLWFDSKGRKLLLSTAALTIVAGVDTHFYLSVKTSIDIRSRIDTSHRRRRGSRRRRRPLDVFIDSLDRRDRSSLLTLRRKSSRPVIHGIRTVQNEMSTARKFRSSCPIDAPISPSRGTLIPRRGWLGIRVGCACSHCGLYGDSDLAIAFQWRGNRRCRVEILGLVRLPE